MPTVENPFVTRPIPRLPFSSVIEKAVGIPSLSRPTNESAAIFAYTAACCAFFAAAVAAAFAFAVAVAVADADAAIARVDAQNA